MPKRTRNSHQPPQGGRCTPAPVRAEILPIGISLGAPKCDLAILASLVCTKVPPQRRIADRVSGACSASSTPFSHQTEFLSA